MFVTIQMGRLDTSSANLSDLRLPLPFNLAHRKSARRDLEQQPIRATVKLSFAI